MKFVKANKLLFSLVLAVFMVILVSMIFLSARISPDMSKYEGKPYYEIPKGESPAPQLTPEAEAARRTKIAHIDPVVKQRLQEQREGIPLPSDIMGNPETIPGVTTLEDTNIGAPVIPGYGKAPKSPYDVMYDEDSPFDFYGRPGRLGKKMKEYMNPDEERKKALGLIDDPDKIDQNPVDTREYVPPGVSAGDDVDLKEFRNSLRKLVFAIIRASNSNKQAENQPLEGKWEEPEPDDSEKED